MDPLVFRAALRATARVAFTAAIVGCGGTAISGGNEDAATAADTGSVGDDAATGTDVATNADTGPVDGGQVGDTGLKGDGALACNAPSPSSLFDTDAAANSVSESLFECCMAELTPLIAMDSGTDSPDAAAADPSVVACCGVVVFAVDHASASPEAGAEGGEIAQFYKLGSTGRSICCDTLGWPGGPTCTPWGPPTPPAMPGEADLAAYGESEVA